MKMDKNVDNSGEDSPPRFNGVDNPRQNVNDALNEILATFTNRYMNGSPNENHAENSDPHPANVQSEQTSQAAVRNSSEAAVVEGIDPSSPLGRSIQVKFLELEEISRRLKTRLNQILCDQEILLSPDADLDWDLNTDSRAEDLTPQEFSQLIQSQVASPSLVENSDKADDLSK